MSCELCWKPLATSSSAYFPYISSKNKCIMSTRTEFVTEACHIVIICHLDILRHQGKMVKPHHLDSIISFKWIKHDLICFFRRHTFYKSVGTTTSKIAYKPFTLYFSTLLSASVHSTFGLDSFSYDITMVGSSHLIFILVHSSSFIFSNWLLHERFPIPIYSGMCSTILSYVLKQYVSIFSAES